MGTGFLPPELMRLTLAHGTESIPASECEEETRVRLSGVDKNVSGTCFSVSVLNKLEPGFRSEGSVSWVRSPPGNTGSLGPGDALGACPSFRQMPVAFRLDGSE